MKVKNFKIKSKIAMFCILAIFCSTSLAENSLTTQKATYVKNILSLAKSSEMRSFMKTNEDPCYDFYEFACGNWSKINPSNRSQKQTSVLEILKRTYKRKIISFLKSNTSASETPADKKIKAFYRSCKAFNDNFDRNELHGLLSDYGTMPLLVGNKWNESRFDWLELLARLKRNFGLQILIGFVVSTDLKHGSINRIFLGQPILKLSSKSLYIDERGLPYRNAYRDEVAFNLERFADLEHGFALHTAEEIVGFEILLAKGLFEENVNLNRSQLTNETTVDDLQAKYAPTIDVRKFLNLTIGYIPKGPIYEFNEQYLKNLKYVVETTNAQLLANYMFYMLLHKFLPHNGLKYIQLNKDNYCRQKVEQHFSKALANMIYRNFNVAAASDDLKTIWHGLRKAFRSKLYSQHLDWISPIVREYAEKKLDDIHMEIDAYVARNFSEDYNNLKITPNNYVKNLQQILQFETQEMFEKINKPTTYFDVDHYDSAIPVNVLHRNTVKLPVMLLQPYLLWAAHYPMALKYGTLGFLIARALIHGFDDKGRLFNKEGELENWWDESTTNVFMTRRDCFMQQYPSFSNKMWNIDENSENIADNTGLSLAFAAFKNWMKSGTSSMSDSLDEDKLPHMNYTKEQIFFISFAQLLCNDIGTSFRPSIEQHIPGKFRVIGALTNFKAFSEVFKCAADSPMNPIQRCEMF